MGNPLLANTPGEKHFLLGNEAIVRGALEGGVGFVSCYPGTPSSEAPDTFYRLAKEGGDFYFEYSVNEKVALEAAGGATLAGVAAMATMKHVGVNVAADPLMTLAYIGAPGGLLLLSADDPGCHSSQNEQDNRYYARLAGMPCFEPATAQEAKDMSRDALVLSRKWEQPVMLRTTTRINHLRGVVEFGSLPGRASRKDFVKNPMRYVPIPAVARVRHLELLRTLKEIGDEMESSPWNKVWGAGRTGVIASGVGRAYLRDVLEERGWADKFRVLELGVTYPLPEKMLLEFLGQVDRVVVVEELEPILENEIRALCQKSGLAVEVLGKGDMLPLNGEYSTSLVGACLGKVLGEEGQDACALCAPPSLPTRPPNLCPGCSHRAVFYAVRRVFGDEAVYSSDIGCYTLGILPPHRMADFLLCMGSSISAGAGMARAGERPVVAFIGDSTFFHSGVTGLINAVFNNYDLLVVILDNRTTAMTGHQPHPGADQDLLGPERRKVDIEAVVRGCGVEQVRKVRPFNVKSTIKAFEEMKALSGVRVLIAEEACVLFARRILKKKAGNTAYVAVQGPDVEACLENLACPAYYREDGEIAVDPSLCAGCMVCLQIAGGVKARKRDA